MSGFEGGPTSGTSRLSEESEQSALEEIEQKTVDAIREGRSIPLPEFLQESREARLAYAEAVKEFGDEVLPQLSKLSVEERDKLAQAFSEAVDEAKGGSLIDAASIEAKLVLLFGIPGNLAASQLEPPYSFILGIASSLVAFGAMGSAISQYTHDRSAREFIKNDVIGLIKQ